MSKAKILNITNMNNNESKWIALDKIEYQDPSGKNRVNNLLYLFIYLINIFN